MAEFQGRDLHLVKKALCIGILTIESQDDGPFKAGSDLTDMKALADDLMPGGVELHHYMRSAHIALTGRPD
ncbi:hypothetical protein NYF14_12105 [Sphingobium sp. 10 DY56-G10]|uniref:hypothetical protein n=1 Tax=Sphingomonadales TaxID=204457 RepID=UPI0000D7A586|nr:hypothetical protein [Sphingomonas sp. SKA58]EAT10564.1 hypothetical protein SKA58_02255 [Sphingomonas sp. SKA58]